MRSFRFTCIRTIFFCFIVEIYYVNLFAAVILIHYSLHIRNNHLFVRLAGWQRYTPKRNFRSFLTCVRRLIAAYEFDSIFAGTPDGVVLENRFIYRICCAVAEQKKREQFHTRRVICAWRVRVACV